MSARLIEDTPGVCATRRFTRIELKQFNGRHGSLSFVAYRGKVYDVSTSFLWQKGSHQALHMAGADLTISLSQAPHGDDLLKKFPVVGILED